MTKHTDATFLAQERRSHDHYLSIWAQRRCDHMMAERAPLAPAWYDLTHPVKRPPHDRLPGMAHEHRGIRIHDEHLARLGLNAATRLACGTTCPMNLEPDACPSCAIRAGLGKPLPRADHRPGLWWQDPPAEVPWYRNLRWHLPRWDEGPHLRLIWPSGLPPDPNEYVPGKWEALLRAPGPAPARFPDMVAHREDPLGMMPFYLDRPDRPIKVRPCTPVTRADYAAKVNWASDHKRNRNGGRR